MMGLVKMSPEAWRYYAEEVALGLEDYYIGRGEEPGIWLGSGAEALGLSGPVSTDQLARLFGQGRHPDTGEALGRPFARTVRWEDRRRSRLVAEAADGPLPRERIEAVTAEERAKG